MRSILAIRVLFRTHHALAAAAVAAGILIPSKVTADSAASKAAHEGDTDTLRTLLDRLVHRR